MKVVAVEAVLPLFSEPSTKPSGKVIRTIAVREDQTFEQLHEALRLAFGWSDPHLYSFWIDGGFWDREAPEYTAPFELEERRSNARSARTPIAGAGLKKGTKLSYLFDYGEEWRLALKVVETWPADDGCYPMLVDAQGTPPPQYEELEDED